MSETDCPYCDTSHEIDTADFRDDGDSMELECENPECGKKFNAVLSISWNYWGEKIDE